MVMKQRFLTIRVDTQTDWVAAVCPELMVSGFGRNIAEALEAVGRSMQSTLNAQRLGWIIYEEVGSVNLT